MEILLVLTVFIPVAGALALILAPRMDYRRARVVALGTALVALGFTAVLMLAFKPGVTTPQFALGGPEGPYGFLWMERASVRFALGLDGISVWLFGLTSLLMITAIFSSWEPIRDRPALHYALLLALETGLLGLFASLDVVLFYVFFEFTLIPLFFLIGIWGGPERRRASITFFLYTLAGSLLTLLGVIALVVVHYQYGTGGLTFSIPELTRGLATVGARWPDWAKADSWTSPQVLIFLLLFAGFAIKVPMFPFHTWLPLAHVEAPTAGSILLAGVLLKVGSYGLLRFNMAMTPAGARFLFPLLATLAVVGVLYGALAALAQSDVKRLIAYSSVSHMGFVVLGMFAMNTTGMNGSAMQMINHGLTTGALFACVGVIYERYHTREMGEMSGLWARLPLFTFFFILSCLGSAALPGLNGFVGEFPILVGAFARHRLSAVLASIGMILGAYYLLWMLQRVVFGPLREPHGHEEHEPGDVPPPEHTPTGHAGPDARHGGVRPVGWHEVAGLTPLMVFIVLIGVVPDMDFNDTRPTIAAIALPYQRMDEREEEQDGPRLGLSRPVAPADAADGPLTQVESKGRR
jgi:NADH-quinone oxidoreductase subunit M